LIVSVVFGGTDWWDVGVGCGLVMVGCWRTVVYVSRWVGVAEVVEVVAVDWRG
jgi:hypothetical protein